MRFLKQATSVDLPVGPFLDDTDGKTAETGLTLTQPDIRLKKNGAAWAQKAAAQTLTHEENGNYEVTLDATDTDTLGHLRLHIAESGALPVWEDFMVLPANIYDSLFAGSNKLQVDVAEWLGTAVATPTIAGVPEVDLTHMGGDPQSATDLKDFADAGYDPATNQVLIDEDLILDPLKLIIGAEIDGTGVETLKDGIESLVNPEKATIPDWLSANYNPADYSLTRIGENQGATILNTDTLLSKADTILERIGSFTGTGINTILGFFKALMSETATTPSDLGGSFSSATDSNEALANTSEAIKDQTDLIPAEPAEVGSAMTLDAGERTTLATAIWNAAGRTLTAISDSAGVTSLVNSMATALTNLATVISDTTAIKGKTNGLNFTGTDVKATLDSERVLLDLTQALDTANKGDTVGGGLLGARAQGLGNWAIVTVGGEDHLMIYAADGETVLVDFNLGGPKETATSRTAE